MAMAMAQQRLQARPAPGVARAASQRRVTCVRVQAFASDTANGGRQSVDEIHRLIGLRIKEAAANVGTVRVWAANAAIGKFVKKAAEDAAAGKLRLKGHGRK